MEKRSRGEERRRRRCRRRRRVSSLSSIGSRSSSNRRMKETSVDFATQIYYLFNGRFVVGKLKPQCVFSPRTEWNSRYCTILCPEVVGKKETSKQQIDYVRSSGTVAASLRGHLFVHRTRCTTRWTGWWKREKSGFKRIIVYRSIAGCLVNS